MTVSSSQTTVSLARCPAEFSVLLARLTESVEGSRLLSPFPLDPQDGELRRRFAR